MTFCFDAPFVPLVRKPEGLAYPLPVVQPPDVSQQNEKPEGLTQQQTALETTVQLAVVVSAFQAFALPIYSHRGLSTPAEVLPAIRA